MRKLFSGVFNLDTSKWEQFVEGISNSDFLMGKVTKFRIFLDWAIREENCTKILEGAYINRQNPNLYTFKAKQEEEGVLETKTEESIDQIPNLDWRKTSKLLTRVVGVREYSAWFKGASFEKYQNNRIYLRVESKFKKDWIENNYIRKIKNAWFEATHGTVERLIISSGEEKGGAYVTAC